MIPVYLHIPRGLNGREAGLVLLPASITGSLASLGAGYYMRVSSRLESAELTISDLAPTNGFKSG